MHHTPLAFLAALSLGCHGSPTPKDAGSANYSASLGDGPDFSEPWGRVQVETWFQYGETKLSGAFADGPQPSHHTEVERSGNCRRLTNTASHCEPACEGFDLCVAEECLPWPTNEDRGALHWTWPDGEQTLEPSEWFDYWGTGSASTEGEVSIAADGIDLTAPTIEAMEENGDWTNTLDRHGDDDAVLRWKNPILHARVRLFMTDCTGTHGGLAENEIECEAPDTGELVIPGAYLTLLEQGDWGQGECGGHDLERYHAAALEGDDTVRLETVADGGLFWFPGRSW